MSHETLQTSYSAKEIAPRIVIGFIAANLSMVLMTRAVDLANGLSAAFTAGGVNPQTAATVADDHAGQLGQLRRDLPDPAGPGRGRPGPGARGGLRDPADGRGAAGRRRPGPARPVRPAADRLGRPLVVAGADRGPGHPGRPGPGADRRRAGVLLPRLAARRHQQHPGADPDHLVPAVHPDAHPVLDRAPRPVPVRPVPAAPRRPVRRHRRRLVPHRPALLRGTAPARRGRRPAAAGSGSRHRAGRPGGTGAGPGAPGAAGRAGLARRRRPRARHRARRRAGRRIRQPPGRHAGPARRPPRPRVTWTRRSPAAVRQLRPEARRELRSPRLRAHPRRRRAPGQDPGRADRPPGRDRRRRRGGHLGRAGRPPGT